MNNAKRLSRRRMLQGSGAALAALGLIGTTGFGKPDSVHANHMENVMSDNHDNEDKPRIVLVHGAFADGTGWQQVIPPWEQDGYAVIAVQNTLTSLANDIATTKRVLDAEAQQGAVIVVGHSYGGAVGAFLEQYPSPLGSGLVADAAGFLTVDRAKFREIFAADVDRSAARVMAAAQKPIFGQVFGQATDVVAWKSIPRGIW